QSSQLGKVNIVSSESYMQHMIYDVLRHVHHKYPNLEIQLELMSAQHVVRHIVDSLAHIGLAYNPPFHTDISTIAHKTEPFILAVLPVILLLSSSIAFVFPKFQPINLL